LDSRKEVKAEKAVANNFFPWVKAHSHVTESQPLEAAKTMPLWPVDRTS